jgi:hypothetical protein
MNETLEKYFNEENLKLAYYRVVCWQERIIKDRFGINAFGANLELNCRNLSDKLYNCEYIPQKGFKFYMPKSSRTQRTKTLLFIEDAIVYQAIANVIASQVYPQLSETEDFVYGSVLVPEVAKGVDIFKDEDQNFFFFKFWKSLYKKFKNSVIKAIEEDQATYKFETDITGFFDAIPHYNLLMTLSSEFGVEDEILDLLSECFNAWSGTKESSTPGVGIPQGPVPSSFFANLLLHPLDKQLMGEAFKYFRYMDDINIYGYSEEDLLDVLVKIDNYLKGHGLSINSKKTKIEKVDPSNDETLKLLKRFEILGEEYDGTLIEVEMDSSNVDISKDIAALLDQSNELDFEINSTIISDPEAIIEFWENEIKLVEKELPKLFEEDFGTIWLIDEEKSDDVEFIKYSTKYGTALRSINEYKKVEANQDLLKYWLFALKKYYWRASNYVITLQYYKNNEELKKGLLNLYDYGKNYECYRYYLVTCLSYNFQSNDRTLREYFKMLKDEQSLLVRYAWYNLIIKGSKDPQLLSSLKATLSAESSEYLKLMVLAYWKRDDKREETMEDLINSVGL